MEEFPSNRASSDRPARRNQEPKRPERVTSGKVVRRKKPLGRRFTETVVGGDARGVWEYVLLDVLIPAARDMIVDAGQEGLRRMVYGESSHGRRQASRHSGGPHGAGFTNYSRYSRSRPDEPRSMSRQARAKHDFDEIILETRVEAEETLDRLFERIDQYKAATVTDLYDIVGVTGNYTDDKYGWTDLRNAGVSRTKGGYLLDLPRPEALD